MTYDTTMLLDQLFSRLCFHAGATPEQFSHRRERFIRSLASYPEDLLCAAYQHILHHLPASRLPTEEEFIEFMTPEFTRRQHAASMEDA